MNAFKKVCYGVICGLFCLNINAQVKTKTFAEGIPRNFLPVKDLIKRSIIVEPHSEFYRLKQQVNNNSIKSSKKQLYKIALPSLVNIDFFKEASFLESNGIATYALTIKSPAALNLSFHFNKFLLSENSVLSIYNDYELTDSITAKENNENNFWATRIYGGNLLNIVLKLPAKEKGQSLLEIKSIYIGFKKFGGRFGSPGASEPCNINVACPLGVGWEAERNSVAIINGGNGFGSGVFVMNSCNTSTPYLLTAKHIIDQALPVANWVFQFFYFSTVCAANTGFREDIQFNGATVKASYGPSDFALVQLNQVPPTNSGIHYAGWNRGGVSGGFFTGLHHPNADVMKISRSNQALLRNASPPYDPTQFWLVRWNQGITANGSSGSPLFDNNHRIIGVLTDGLSFCSTSNLPDWYGSFDRSWTGGGTNATRLSNWLNPNNSGATTTNTTNIAALLPANPILSISGSNAICGTSATYTLNGANPGSTITWSQQGATAAGSYILPLQNVASVPPTGNPITVTKISNGNIRLVATVTNCNGTVTGAGKDIVLGVPSVYNNGAYQDNVNHTKVISGTVNPTYITNVPIVLVYANNQYTWTKTGGSPNATWSVCCTPNNSSATVIFNRPVTYNNQIAFNITTSNSCGSRSDPVYIIYNGPNIYSVSPNPARTEITVEDVTANKPDKLTAAQSIKGFNRIQIVDKRGIIVLDTKYANNTKKVKVNVSLLKSDVYVVRIFSEGKTEEHKIVVQH